MDISVQEEVFYSCGSMLQKRERGQEQNECGYWVCKRCATCERGHSLVVSYEEPKTHWQCARRHFYAAKEMPKDEQ